MPTGLMIAIGKVKPGARGGKMPPEPPEPISGKPKMAEAEEPEVPKKPERSAAMIDPMAVNFRTGDETCGNCSHFGKDGGCDLLGIECQAGDSCNAFSQRMDEEPEEGGYEEEPEGKEMMA